MDQKMDQWKKASDLPAISAENFCTQLNACHVVNSPVRITGDGSDAVGMSTGVYDEMISIMNDIADPDIKYYICEFEADEILWDQLREIATEKEMNLNELFIWMIEQGLDRNEVILESDIDEEWPETMALTMIRSYPVRKGETEIQARRKTIEKESEEKKRNQEEGGTI